MQERLTSRAKREELSLLRTGSGARTNISSVIELCAFDWIFFFLSLFCRNFFKNKEIER